MQRLILGLNLRKFPLQNPYSVIPLFYLITKEINDPKMLMEEVAVSSREKFAELRILRPRQVLDDKLTQSEIAILVGRTKSWVSRRITGLRVVRLQSWCTSKYRGRNIDDCFNPTITLFPFSRPIAKYWRLQRQDDAPFLRMTGRVPSVLVKRWRHEGCSLLSCVHHS
jgi:hypothetical protein